MKLTADLINQSPSKLNPLKQRELDLRGLKIPLIENLGVTKDQNDLLDLTDNDIRSLSNFPLLSRLSILLISNNQISRFSNNLPFTLPNLQSLNLNNNHLTSISSLLPLAKFPRLQYLSLMGNPVARLKHYRDFLIWKLKPLRVLDFNRIKDKERSNAKSLFELSDGRPSSLSISLTTKTQEEIQKEEKELAEESNTFEVGQASSSKNQKEGERGGKGRLMTLKERKALEKLIENSQSLEEIRKLEEKLRDGFMPQEEEEEQQQQQQQSEITIEGKDVDMDHDNTNGKNDEKDENENGNADGMQIDEAQNQNKEDEEDGVDATTLDQEAEAAKNENSSKKPAGRGGRGRGRGRGRGKK